MRDAIYENPKYKIPDSNLPKVAYVLSAFVPEGKRLQWFGRDLDRLERLRFNLAVHNHWKSGVAYDIILVNNGSEDAEAVAWMKENFSHYLERENDGYGFGGWKFAWDTYKDKYDYYLFTEDDMVPTKDGWLSEILLKFHSKPGIGAVGNFVEARSERETMSDVLWRLADYHRDMMYNFDGGYTFTSSRILKQVDDIGGFPIFSMKKGFSASINECLFQQPILELGYGLLAFDDGEHDFYHGSEVFLGQEKDPYFDVSKIAPLIDGNTRFTKDKIKKHFSWYEG